MLSMNGRTVLFIALMAVPLVFGLTSTVYAGAKPAPPFDLDARGTGPATVGEMTFTATAADGSGTEKISFDGTCAGDDVSFTNFPQGWIDNTVGASGFTASTLVATGGGGPPVEFGLLIPAGLPTALKDCYGLGVTDALELTFKSVHNFRRDDFTDMSNNPIVRFITEVVLLRLVAR